MIQWGSSLSVHTYLTVDAERAGMNHERYPNRCYTRNDFDEIGIFLYADILWKQKLRHNGRTV